MPAPHNMLKSRLAEGDVVFGCWLGMADAYVAEIAATSGFDWLLIDGEHAPNDMPSLSAQFAAIEGKGPSPMMRLPDDDPTKIKQALDIGLQNLLIPMVDSAEQARTAFRATRYPPEGFRGVGSSLARASRFSQMSDYLTTAGDQICLLVQAESRAGFAALPDVLKIDGVDGVFIGPSDLAADMGLLGQPDHPSVKAAVLAALSQIRSAGKIAGVLATDLGFAAECRAAGANFIGVGVDVLIYAKAMRDLASAVKSELPWG